MSSLVLSGNSYLNIGNAVQWREVLMSHSTSICMKTTCQEPSCLVSLRNETYEAFAIYVNTSARGTGGLSVKLQDIDGNILEAFTDVPPLADDRWHLIEVEVQQLVVSFRIDGKRITALYASQPQQMTTFISPTSFDRPVYPSRDLIGGVNHSGRIEQTYVGRLSDMFVSKGGFDGPRLHWWIVDLAKGSTVWDRGYFSLVPPGMHLHCCNCEWDSEDHPASALFLRGMEGFYACVPSMNREFFSQEIGCCIEEEPVQVRKRRPPVVLDEFEKGNESSASRFSICSRSRVSISFRMQTHSKGPAVVLGIPSRPDNILVILNFGGKRSVGLLIGSKGFTANVDLCKNTWRHVCWVIDPLAGVSLFLDGARSSIDTQHDVSLAATADPEADEEEYRKAWLTQSPFRSASIDQGDTYDARFVESLRMLDGPDVRSARHSTVGEQPDGKQLLHRKSRTAVGADCFLIGHYFCGSLRDLCLQVGGASYSWSLTQGRGSTIPCDRCQLFPIEVRGRYALWPKVESYPRSTLQLDGQPSGLTVGTFIAAPNQPFEISFFVQIASSSYRSSDMVSVEGAAVIQHATERIVVVVCDSSSLHLFVASTLLLEDMQWHCVQLLIPALGVTSGMVLTVDSTPVDLLPLSAAPRSPSISNRASSMNQQACDTRSTSSAESSQDPLRDILARRESLAMDPDDLDMLTPTSARRATSVRVSQSALANQLAFLQVTKPEKRIRIGGAGFRGTVAFVTAANSTEKVHWPLDEGCGAKFSRTPALPEASKKTSSVPRDLGTVEWKPTDAPQMALHLNGETSYIEAVGFSTVFPVTSLASFCVIMWLKYTGTSPQQSCLFSIHDRTSPSLEASAGIYCHTRVLPHTSPKKRIMCPMATTLMICDSAERCLAFEFTGERLYDGLWHKIEWTVQNPEKNASQVRVDDRLMDVARVCEECPRDFKYLASGNNISKTLTMNVGAKDEGDQGVTQHFAGDVRGFRISTASDEAVVDWAMDEGGGAVLYDAKQPPIIGRMFNAVWELTTFPPRTPVFSPKSNIEVEPIGDTEEEFIRSSELTIAGTLRAPNSSMGAVFAILSRKHRRVIASLTLNEGGDIVAREEWGTHTFRMAVPHVDAQRTEYATTIVPPKPTSGTRPRRGSYRRRRLVSVVRSSVQHDESAGGSTSESEKPEFTVRSFDVSTPNTSLTHGGGSTRSIDALKPSASADTRAPSMATRSSVQTPEENLLGESGHESTTAPGDLVDIVKFQIHFDDLTDGAWHELEWQLNSDPTASTVHIDGRRIPILLISRVPTLWRSDDDELHSPSRSTSAPRPLEWGSFVIGRTPVMDAFEGSIENVLIRKTEGSALLFIPLAGSTTIHSEIPRDLAMSNITWELSIPPISCLFLGGDRYVSVPALATLKQSQFEFLCKIRTIHSACSACLLEIGRPDVGALKLMINQNAQGSYEPCVLHGSVIDSDGLALDADCVADVLFDDEWHTIVWTVKSSSENSVSFSVDDVELVVRYGNCCGPRNFSKVAAEDQGGSIGAIVENVTPSQVFHGMIQRAVLRDPVTGCVHACYELTKGYGIVLADSSGNRNHAIAVNAVWRTCTLPDKTSAKVPKIAVDLARSARCTVSRWSNNPGEECLRDEVSKEVVVSAWPTDGWRSGAQAPQWCSFDLEMCCTIFQIELTLDRATPSTHEIYLARLAPSAFKKSGGEHIVTLAERIQVRSSSSRVIKTAFSYPYYNVRFVRVLTAKGSTPVAYSSVVIYGTKSVWHPPRGRISFMMTERQRSAVSFTEEQTPFESPTPLLTSSHGSFAVVPEEPPRPKTQAEKERERRRLFFTADVDRIGFILPEDFAALYSTIDIFQTPKERVLDAVFSVIGDEDRINFDQFCILLSRLERWWGRAGELKMYEDQREGYASGNRRPRLSFHGVSGTNWSQDLV